MSIDTAIIGLGIMGQRMLERMVAHHGYRPIAIWDPDPAACRAALSIAPEVVVCEDASDAIAAAQLVYLACPPVAHKTYALQAADVGKALFLEKPLGVDVAESKDLVDRLKVSGVPAAVNFTQAAGSALGNVTKAAQSGDLGELVGADIVLTYAAWPRAWQQAADWLRFRAEGGMTREVLSHFLFFSERVFGPLSLVWARPSYPDDPSLCETQMAARLEGAGGMSVNLFASVGGAQPDRQELTIKGTLGSRRITDFYVEAHSDGSDFVETEERPIDPRAVSLNAQLDQLLLCIEGQPHRLATLEEALRVQILVETMLAA